MFLTRKARLRKAPSGSRQEVVVLPMDVDQAIQKWDNLGYDLHHRSRADEDTTLLAQRRNRYARINEQHVILTFVKR